MDPDDVMLELHRHVHGYWPTGLRRFTWDLGDFPREFPRFRVYEVAPTSHRPYWVYVSTGAWEAYVREGRAHEFILHSPVAEPLHVEKMAALARRQADPQVKKLEVGSVIPLGEPWLEGAACDHLYFASAAAYPDEFDFLELDGLTIRFLWAIPVHGEEARFIEREGGETFEDRLGEAGVSLVDPQRPPVA